MHLRTTRWCTAEVAASRAYGQVVYRGYEASKLLQDVHDNAVRCRTELGLKQERLEQEQRERDIELRRCGSDGVWQDCRSNAGRTG